MDLRTFLTKLFDTSFSELITRRMVSALYVVAILCSAVLNVAMVICGFSSGPARAILTLLVAPIFFLLHVIMARVALEVVLLLFQIAETNGAENGPKEL